MNNIRSKQKGFTIVELLIVIVIIGILAAITIVAYNGIQQRAKNTVTEQAVASYAKAFEGYKAINGAYPGGYACVTGASTACGNITDTTSACFGVARLSGLASLDSALSTIITNLPQPPQQSAGCSTGQVYTGVFFDGGTRLVWFLNGSQTCGNVGGLTGADSLVSGGVTRCFAYLPQ